MATFTRAQLAPGPMAPSILMPMVHALLETCLVYLVAARSTVSASAHRTLFVRLRNDEALGDTGLTFSSSRLIITTITNLLPFGATSDRLAAHVPSRHRDPEGIGLP